jgi:UMF1 family MFS transporter
MNIKINKKSVFSWCLYDWANTAFSTVIITFIFSVYFAKQIVGDETEGSAQWGFMIAISGLIIAFMSPFLGAVADNSGARKTWLFWLSLLCIIPTTCLWFAVPGSSIIFVLVLVALANIGLELSQVFANAMLPYIAPKEKIGRVSGWAWALGYAGGLCALALTLFGFIGLGDMKPLIALPQEKFEHIRIVGPIVGVWFFVFMVPLLLFTQDVKMKALGFWEALSVGLKQLSDSAKAASKHKNFLWFLVSSAIYRDGLVTLFAIGGVYAAGQFGMGFTDLMIFAIGLNVTAAIGAFAFAFIDDYLGSKPTIIIALIGLIIIGTIILMIEDKDIFIYLSLGLGTFMGPVQAASRTMVSKLCPKEMITQGYGLYSFTGKSIAFLGPLMFGVMTSVFQTQQAGMASIVMFWVVGLLILLKVKERN